jgi:ABC-type sugar transport system ATPase subunit
LDRREAPAPDGAAITLGIRPHDITLTAPEKGDARGRVEVVEPLGTATLIHLRSDDGSSELVRVVVSADTRAEVDGRVGLTLRRDRLHLFDAETGRRLSGSP